MMTGAEAGALVAALLLLAICLYADIRSYSKPRESRELRRAANQAIDLTGGQR